MLHAPKLIKNLISVRQFTKDNSVSVEFDPCGFSVNDLQTGARLVRCDSTGDLYPLFSINQATPPDNPTPFTAIHLLYGITVSAIPVLPSFDLLGVIILLIVIRLVPVFVLRVLLGNFLSYHFMNLYQTLLLLLILSIVISGLPLS